MGPHFDRASTRVGRRRLPPGYVAVLDDPQGLRDVVTELHAYALAGGQPRLGVLFREVGTADREGIRDRIVHQFGAASLLDQSAVFGVEAGYHYVIDTEGVAHAWHRHADPVAEPQHGQVPLGLGDFGEIPGVVRPRSITEFVHTKGVPRIIYEAVLDGGTMTVVLEVQHSRKWLVVRTAYKRK